MTPLPVNRQTYYLEADARRLDRGYALDPAAIPVILDSVLDELDDLRKKSAGQRTVESGGKPPVWYRGQLVTVVDERRGSDLALIRWPDGVESWVGAELLRPLTDVELVRWAAEARS